MSKERLIYFRCPSDIPKDMPGIRPRALCQILQGFHGLRDAQRLCWKRLESEILKLGFYQTKLDPCLFVLYGKNSELIAVVGTHVDDLLCCANPEGEAKIKQLTQLFIIK